jgi:hypothetical protein
MQPARGGERQFGIKEIALRDEEIQIVRDALLISKHGQLGALMVKEPLYDYVENDGQPYPAAWTWIYRCGT